MHVKIDENNFDQFEDVYYRGLFLFLFLFLRLFTCGLYSTYTMNLPSPATRTMISKITKWCY